MVASTSEPIRVNGPVATLMPLRFSTMYEDNVTGDRKYLFRDLTPGAGRWKSRDPIEEEDGVNLFAFLRNDGLSKQDFLGLKYFSLWEMQQMSLASFFKFRERLVSLCPCESYTWNSTSGEQICTKEACLAQADALARDFTKYLRKTFTAQFRRFGNIIAFTSESALFSETINSRAVQGPGEGMTWLAYNAGYGLKCQGMQDLMRRRFDVTISPYAHAKSSCFKGANVGNGTSILNASHHWFGVYSGNNSDFTKVDIHVDPWHSAGGVIAPGYFVSGESKYFWSLLLW